VKNILKRTDEIIINIDSKKLLSVGIVLGIFLFVLLTYVQALLAFVAPSGNFPLDVTSVSTRDDTNITQSIFGTGDIVRINTTIEKALSYVNFPFSYAYFDFLTDTNYRVVVTVMDNTKRPVYIQSAQFNLSPGSIEVAFFDYSISAGASLGTYSFEVMIWSDWLPGGKALSDSSWEGTFTVA
jgi:hypothetical protein